MQWKIIWMLSRLPDWLRLVVKPFGIISTMTLRTRLRGLMSVPITSISNSYILYIMSCELCIRSPLGSSLLGLFSFWWSSRACVRNEPLANIKVRSCRASRPLLHSPASPLTLFPPPLPHLAFNIQSSSEGFPRLVSRRPEQSKNVNKSLR